MNELSVRYLRAEELARLAGVAKSTVLAAIRRGEIASSRTVGRGTRISLETARAYLESRGCPIPSELREASASAAAVVTEAGDFAAAVRRIAPGSWTVSGDGDTYATLLGIGAHAPAVVVIDLAIAMLHPFEIIRALAARSASEPRRIVAVGTQPELLDAARAMGATEAIAAGDPGALARIFGGDGLHAALAMD